MMESAATVGEQDVKPDDLNTKIKELNEAVKQTEVVFEEGIKDLEKKRSDDLALVQTISSHKVKPIAEERIKRMSALDRRFADLRKNAKEAMDRVIKEAKREHQLFVNSEPKRLREEKDKIRGEFQPQIVEIERECAMKLATMDEKYDVMKAKLKEEFDKVMGDLKKELGELNEIRKAKKEEKKKAG